MHSEKIKPTSSPVAYGAERVFDGEAVLREHAVVVENGVIAAVLPLHAVPKAMPVWQEPDITLLPGLLDVHVHFMKWEGPLFLAHGVTTVRDVGNRLEWILEQRAAAPRKPWPRILTTGPLVNGPVAYHPRVSMACADLPAAIRTLRDLAIAGVDGIKLYVGLDASWLPALVKQGHQDGLKVSIHCSGAGALAAARAKVDEFFHLDGLLGELWPGHPPGWLSVWGMPGFDATGDRQQEVADALQRRGIVITPTLAYWESQCRVRSPGFSDSAEFRYVPDLMVKWQSPKRPDPEGALLWRRALEAAQKFVGLLVERGAPVLAGTDVPCGAVAPGLSLWKELALLVQAGMTPVRALRAATVDAARFLGHPELGRLKAGAPADMVMVRGNPLDRIPETPLIRKVMRGGVVWESEQLLAAAPAKINLDEPWAAQCQEHYAGSGK